MGICFDLYCVDCREHFSLEKQGCSRYFIPRIMTRHGGHEVYIFHDVVSCVKEKKFKSFKSIAKESFDTPENEVIPRLTEEEFGKFLDEHRACDNCGGARYPYCY